VGGADATAVHLGRFKFLADAPPPTVTSNNSAPCTVAMARILASWASSETPCSACLSR
jgi:hypothetical protein